MHRMYKKRAYSTTNKKRKKTLELMVKNYYKQVEIVGFTDLTLSNYLKNIGLKDKELEYAIKNDKNR